MSTEPDARHEHHCQRSDDVEDELRNRELFGRFAAVEFLPLYPEPRRSHLAQLQWRWRTRTRDLRRAAGSREPELSEPVPLWPPRQIRDNTPAPRSPTAARDERRLFEGWEARRNLRITRPGGRP